MLRRAINYAFITSALNARWILRFDHIHAFFQWSINFPVDYGDATKRINTHIMNILMKLLVWVRVSSICHSTLKYVTDDLWSRKTWRHCGAICELAYATSCLDIHIIHTYMSQFVQFENNSNLVSRKSTTDPCKIFGC